MEGKGKADRTAQFGAMRSAILAAEVAADWGKILDILGPVAADKPGLWPVGAHVRRAQALEKLDRCDEASVVHAKLREAFPDHIAGWRNGARMAQMRKDWDEAAALWAHCTGHPDAGQDQASWEGLANALRRSGRTAEAALAFATLRERWPDNWQGWAGPAQLAGDAGRWPMAARIWTACAERFAALAPMAVSVSLITALIRAGRPIKAAQKIVELRQRDHASGRWMALRIDLLLAQGDPQSAAVEISDFVSHPAFLSNFTPELLASIAVEARFTAAQANDWLHGLIDITAPLAKAAEFYWIKPEGGPDTQAAMAEYQDRMQRNWLGEYQLALRQFIGNRTCGQFTRLAKIAMAYLPRPKVAILLALAEKRFARSRIRRQLDSFLNGPKQGVWDPYEDFDPAWRRTVPNAAHSITAQIANRPWRRVVCVVMVCNEDEMLPVFVQHHRMLGVESFIIIDNNSTHSPAKVLDDIPGVEITHVDAPFSFIDSGNGMSWINEVLDAQISDWVLFADCDELLVFPGSGTIRLPALLDHLDQQGQTALPGLMVDLYDRDYLRNGRTSSDLTAHTLFCASQDVACDLRPPGRGVFNRKRPPGVITPASNKCPLVKGSAGVRYTGNHWTTPCVTAETTAVLLHYKIFRDRELVGMTSQDVMNHPRVRDRQQNQLDRHLYLSTMVIDTSFDHPFHLDLSEARLLRLGYMVADSAWRRQISPRLRADMKTPATMIRPGLTYAGKFGAYNFPFADGFLRDVLVHLRRLAMIGQRETMRRLLNLQLARIGRREVALALVLCVAVWLQHDRAAARLLVATCKAILASGNQGCAPAIRDITDALEDHPDIARSLLNALTQAMLMKDTGPLVDGSSPSASSIQTRGGHLDLDQELWPGET